VTTAYLQWSDPAGDKPSSLALLPIAAKEARRHLIPLVTIFVLIAFAVLVWGMLRPSTYTSSTTILVEDKNIITPLMEGRTAITDDANRAVLASEVVFSRRTMNEILRSGGWMEAKPTPLEQERLISDIKSRTTVDVTSQTKTRAEDSGLSVIKIAYTDSDPKRAHRVAKRFGELLIGESLSAKARESRGAYEFIDAETRKYQAALRESEAKLAKYRSANPDARPGADLDVSARIGELRRTVDNARLDLGDLRSREAQLKAELAGESEVGTGLSRSGQFRARMAELQAERDRLSLNYTSEHPDMVRVENQMRDLERQFRSGGSRASSRIAGTPTILGNSAGMNPIYGQIRGLLAEVRPQSAAAATRMSLGQQMLQRELDRGRRIINSEATLAALTRDHEVNRELYHDLLRRRENARVSMNLDAKSSDLNFHVQEPASEPLRPSGLRLMHFAGAGLLLAIATPLLLLSLLVKKDPRVRSPLQIERDLSLPVLGSIPVHLTRERQAGAKRQLTKATLLFLTVPIIYGVILLLKFVDAI
jgi:polysaccharide chain length determinant protein (PEP-CTERM system associated)